MSQRNCLRLLMVVPSATSFTTFFKDVATAWMQDGNVAAVACGPLLAGNEPSWPRDVSRLHLPEIRDGSIASFLKAVWSLGTHIRAWKPDIIHAHFAIAIMLAAATRSLGFGRKAIWTGTFHGLHATAGGISSGHAVAHLEAWAGGRMSQIWVLNEEDRRYLAECAHLRDVSIVWPFGMGCDTSRFGPGRCKPFDQAIIREKLGLALDQPVLIYIGRHVEFKGFAATVRAFWLLQQTHPRAVLLLAGERDTAHACGLTAAEADRLTNDEGIRCLGWREDVERLLAVSDLCVFPSGREGMPVNVMESLASGVPVITTNSRGCRDLVRNGVDGVVLDNADSALIAAAVSHLLKDTDKRLAMSRAAIAGSGRFTRAGMVSAQIAAYKSLLRPCLVNAS